MGRFHGTTTVTSLKVPIFPAPGKFNVGSSSSGRLKKRDRLVHVAWLECGFVGQRIIATLIDGAPRAATETSIGAFLLEILRFHFLHLLQELLQHLPRLRPSGTLQPIQRFLLGRGALEIVGLADLDL